MPVAGRKPKPEGQTRHRNKPTFDWVEVLDVPFTGAPKLPPRADRKPWSAWTKAWWKAVSSMPHCVLWSESDWRYAFDAALVAAELHDGDIKAAPALERREKVMGTTVDYRRDLRIRYVAEVEENETPASVTDMADYRSAFSG